MAPVVHSGGWMVMETCRREVTGVIGLIRTAYPIKQDASAEWL